MVLVEAMASGTPVVATDSGAIPEVRRPEARTFAPGDWIDLAHKLATGPLSQPPGQRATYDPERVARYSIPQATERIAAAYDRLLS